MTEATGLGGGTSMGLHACLVLKTLPFLLPCLLSLEGEKTGRRGG